MPTLDEHHHVIRPRRVRFDWTGTPMHWIPGDPHTTHVANVLHLLLPAGEKWFVDVFREALPYAGEDELRDEVKAFMGQEATHARAHAAVIDHLRAHGLETARYTRRIDWLFGKVLRPRNTGMWASNRVGRFLSTVWLKWQLAIIAGIEHFTAVLGWWVVVAPGLERAGADPTMLDMLRWHGAEEVEHRSVAFDLAKAAKVGYVRRFLTMIGVLVMMIGCWIEGTWFLLRNDPTLKRGGMVSLRKFRRAGKDGKMPLIVDILRAVPRYLHPRYHPSSEGRTQVALDYLATSPAATAATATAAAA